MFKTKRGVLKGDRVHEKHALAMCNAGCFGPLTRLAHKAVVKAYVAAEPAIDISASFDAFVMSGGTSKTLVMATDLVYSDQFARDAMMYLNMSMKYVDCARAVLDDPELDAAHEKYPEVMRALRDVSTSDDIFDKSECAGMMCVAWILRWRLKFGDEQGASEIHEAVVKHVKAKSPISDGLFEVALGEVRAHVAASQTA